MIKELRYIFGRNEKIRITVLFFMALIGSIFECMGVGVFVPLVEMLMNTDSIYENDLLHAFYTNGGFQSVQGFLTVITAIIIFFFVFKNIYLIIEKYLIYSFSFNMQNKISTKLLRAYMKESYTFHLNQNIAVLQRGMQSDADKFAKAIINIMELMIEITICISLGIYLLYISKSITLIVVGMLGICVGIFTLISKKYSVELGKQGQVYSAKLYQWMNQSLGGIKEVKVLNREQYFVKSYERYFREYVNVLKYSRLLSNMPKYIVEMVSISAVLLAIMVKMNYGKGELVTFVPQLSAFAIAAFKLLPAVGKINEYYSNILNTSPAIHYIYDALKNVEDVNLDFADSHDSWEFSGSVELKNICYHYPDTNEDVISQANMTIQKGTTVAIIGESGAGKTTLVDILLGLLEPQYGKIMADGMNIYKNINTWHKVIGYIPQTIYLSDDTIKSNVAFGIDEEEIDESAVRDALEKAQLLDFVDNLPLGLETMVGDRGVRLSGGQRQRIGIARALYHNPEILVLDEATSALDSKTENAVMDAVDKLQGQKTIIIIAHRLTTIQNADVIYEVKNGAIVERKKKDVLNS